MSEVPFVVQLSRDDQLYLNETVVYTAKRDVLLRIDYIGPVRSPDLNSSEQK